MMMMMGKGRRFFFHGKKNTRKGCRKLGKRKKEGNFERFFEDELERERPRIRAGNGEAKYGER